MALLEFKTYNNKEEMHNSINEDKARINRQKADREIEVVQEPSGLKRKVSADVLKKIYKILVRNEEKYREESFSSAVMLALDPTLYSKKGTIAPALALLEERGVIDNLTPDRKKSMKYVLLNLFSESYATEEGYAKPSKVSWRHIKNKTKAENTTTGTDVPTIDTSFNPVYEPIAHARDDVSRIENRNEKSAREVIKTIEYTATVKISSYEDFLALANDERFIIVNFSKT